MNVAIGPWSTDYCRFPVVYNQSLVRDRGDGRRGVSHDSEGGETATTHVRPLMSNGRYTAVECLLETGRTNQIRIHLSEGGHLICGDGKYAVRADGTRWEETSGAPRLALHAHTLSLKHPLEHHPLRWHQPWPEEFLPWAR